MPIQIDIPDHQLDRIKDMYVTMGREILDRLEKAQQEWADIQPTLAKLGIKLVGGGRKPKLKTNNEVKISYIDASSEFNPKWNWTQKATYVLKLKGKPMTAKQILEVLFNDLEPSLDRATAVNSLPATLSVQARKNHFSRTFEDGEYTYDIADKSINN